MMARDSLRQTLPPMSFLSLITQRLSEVKEENRINREHINELMFARTSSTEQQNANTTTHQQNTDTPQAQNDHNPTAGETYHPATEVNMPELQYQRFIHLQKMEVQGEAKTYLTDRCQVTLTGNNSSFVLQPKRIRPGRKIVVCELVQWVDAELCSTNLVF